MNDKHLLWLKLSFLCAFLFVFSKRRFSRVTGVKGRSNKSYEAKRVNRGQNHGDFACYGSMDFILQARINYQTLKK